MRVGGRGGLEADGEEDHLAVGVAARQLHGVERRVDHPDIAAGRLDRQQIGGEPGTRSMSPNEVKITSGRRGDGERLVDQLERRDADRAARAVNQRLEQGLGPKQVWV
jgi:hypothetical protein